MAAVAAILFIVFPRKPDIVRAPLISIDIAGQLVRNAGAARATRKTHPDAFEI